MNPKEGHHLQQELVAWLTMLSDPIRHDLHVVNQQAARAYNISPPHALMALAAVSASRFEFMRELLQQQAGPEANLAFPREQLLLEVSPGPGMTQDDVATCLDLVESIRAEEVDQEAVQRLLDLGPAAFITSAGVAIALGWMAVGIAPDLNHLSDLIAQEGVATEQGWIEREQQGE